MHMHKYKSLHSHENSREVIPTPQKLDIHEHSLMTRPTLSIVSLSFHTHMYLHDNVRQILKQMLISNNFLLFLCGEIGLIHDWTFVNCKITKMLIPINFRTLS